MLTVCTGNICRSRLAERLLQTGFDALEPGRFEVSSAGTQALAGYAMDTRTAELAVEHDAVDDGRTARRLTERLLDRIRPDLVIGLAREHRAQVLELAPSLLHKTFTLREFARLIPLADVPAQSGSAQRWKALVASAAARRALARPADPVEDDVVDPYRQPESVYRRMEAELVPAVEAMLGFERTLREAS